MRALLLALAATGALDRISASCPDGWTFSAKSGRCIGLVPSGTAAHNSCDALCGNGTLASITDASEMAEVMALLQDPQAWSGTEPVQVAWIGYYDAAASMTGFRWAGGVGRQDMPDKWRWADGASPPDGSNSSKCTSHGGDCLAPGEEPATCADGYVAVPLEGSTVQYHAAIGYPEGWYTCCPPSQDQADTPAPGCGTAFAAWNPDAAGGSFCAEERCTFLAATSQIAGQTVSTDGWYSWPCAAPLPAEFGVVSTGLTQGACVCTDAPPHQDYLDATGILAANTCASTLPPADRNPALVGGICTFLTALLAATFLVYPSVTNAYHGSAEGGGTELLAPGAQAQPSSDAAAENQAATKKRRVDTSALTGLRGVAAMHVALGHHFQNSCFQMDLYGGAAMPFFYLLSGFVMAIAYGSERVAIPGDLSGQHGRVFDIRKFWRNRFARLAPVYYVTNWWYLANPTTWYMIQPWSGILSLFGMSSWFGFGFPPNGVTWTISTMMFFYVIFPYILPRMQRMEPKVQLERIGQLYVLQFVLFLALDWGIGELEGEAGSGYWYGRAHPISRLPVFVMGCLAALHRNRELHARPGDELGQESWAGCFCGCGLCGNCCVGGGEAANARRTDRCLVGYLFMIIFCVFNDHVFMLDIFLPNIMRTLSEAFCPVLILALILSSTRDGGRSVTSRLCVASPFLLC